MNTALTQPLTQSLKLRSATMAREINTIENDLNTAKDDLTRGTNTVDNDLAKEINAIKNDLNAVKDNLNTLKNDLTKEINALEKALKTNIAAREMNSLIRTRNTQSSELVIPLRSVFTNTPIPRFPKTLLQFKQLSDPEIRQFLQALDDPYHDPDYGTPEGASNRLWMLAGIQEHSPFVPNNVDDANE